GPPHARQRSTVRSCRRNREVGEIAAGVVTHPQTDQSALPRAEEIDLEARLFRVADESTHVVSADDHASPKPAVWVGRGVDTLLVLPGLFGPQLLPAVTRQRVVLHRVTAVHGTLGAEVERAEVDGIVGLVGAVKRDAEKALLSDVFAAKLAHDDAGREIGPRQERDRLTGSCGQSDARSRPLGQTTDCSVATLEPVRFGEPRQIDVS